MDRPQSLVFPHGVDIPIDLPPFSFLPDLSIKELDQALYTVVSLDTNFFPVLRDQHFGHINRSIEQWHQ